MVDRDRFIDNMAARLVAFDAQNVTTPALRRAWSQIGEVLNEQVYGAPTDARWPVVPAELAVGKSLSIKVFTSMMPREQHPGVLIVVNRQAEADATAAAINEWAGDEVAKSYHREVKDVSKDLTSLAKYPVLVICHRRFELGLDQGSERFEALFDFNGGRRQCVLIDEALELVYMAAVPSGRLRELLALLPARYNRPHAAALDVLDNFLKVMRRHSGASRRLAAEELVAGLNLTPAEAQITVEQLGRAVAADKHLDFQAKRDIDSILCAVLHQLNEDHYHWQYTDKRSMAESLHGHRLLSMPAGTRGVIFDATARLNFVYTSRPHEFRLVDVEPARDHSHVEVRVAYGGRTGREALLSEAKAQAQAKLVLTDVLRALGPDAKAKHVLIATHEVGEAAYLESPLARRFASLETCHWNGITGENRWGACDVGVVASLPYLPSPVDLSTTMAALSKELEDKELNGDLEELKQVRAMRMAAEVTQFMGRLQRSTAPAPTTIFLRLPDHQQSIRPDQLLGLILATLPGAAKADWEGASRKAPRPGRSLVAKAKLSAAVEAYLAQAKGDTLTANQVREATGASTAAWGRYLQRTKRVAGFHIVRPDTPGQGRHTLFVRYAKKLKSA
jgi:hypothetical protein